MDSLKEFDFNGDGQTDLGEIAMGIELKRGKEPVSNHSYEDMEEEHFEDTLAEE